MARSGSHGRPRRRVTDRAARKDILVFVEGSRTEPEYLQHWHRAYRTQVNVSIDPFTGPPRALIDRAVAAKRLDERDARRGRGRAYDEIWCVFDVDEHPLLDEVEMLAAAHGIRLAISNPCIELWFLLHFQDQTGHIERGIVQRESARLLGSRKTLSVSALELLEARHGEAVRRAQALDAKHAGDGSPPRTNPSTTVWTIIESIRGA